MSAISEKVRTALFTKLNVSGVTSLVGGIYYELAPVTASLPYVVFSRIPGTVDRAFSDALIGERDLWMVKAITDEDSSSTQSPQGLGQTILAACETAIGSTLSLTGASALRVVRKNDIPSYQEVLSDRVIYHQGFHLEVYAG